MRKLTLFLSVMLVISITTLIVVFTCSPFHEGMRYSTVKNASGGSDEEVARAIGVQLITIKYSDDGVGTTKLSDLPSQKEMDEMLQDTRNSMPMKDFERFCFRKGILETLSQDGSDKARQTLRENLISIFNDAKKEGSDPDDPDDQKVIQTIRQCAEFDAALKASLSEEIH